MEVINPFIRNIRNLNSEIRLTSIQQTLPNYIINVSLITTIRMTFYSFCNTFRLNLNKEKQLFIMKVQKIFNYRINIEDIISKNIINDKINKLLLSKEQWRFINNVI